LARQGEEGGKRRRKWDRKTPKENYCSYELGSGGSSFWVLLDVVGMKMKLRMGTEGTATRLGLYFALASKLDSDLEDFELVLVEESGLGKLELREELWLGTELGLESEWDLG
jgi:hypothetical protein